jgi:hypothetical protein
VLEIQLLIFNRSWPGCNQSIGQLGFHFAALLKAIPQGCQILSATTSICALLDHLVIKMRVKKLLFAPGCPQELIIKAPGKRNERGFHLAQEVLK